MTPMMKKIIGALQSARASHPEIDYAGYVTSIAKRVAGALSTQPEDRDFADKPGENRDDEYDPNRR